MAWDGFRFTGMVIGIVGLSLNSGEAGAQDRVASALTDQELGQRLQETRQELERRLADARALLLQYGGESMAASPQPVSRSSNSPARRGSDPPDSDMARRENGSAGNQNGQGGADRNPRQGETTTANSESERRGTGDEGEGSQPTNGRQKFGGIEFGVGMAFSLDLGENRRVREAELVNNVVRVTHSDDVRARLILETHYFFVPPGRGIDLLGIRNPTEVQMRSGEQPRWGFGPFVAVQPGSDNIIDAIGAGIMLGLRRSIEGTDSFNIGIGVLYDMDVQILGDGIRENEPLPPGETEIRYRREAQSGLMVMSSFSF